MPLSRQTLETLYQTMVRIRRFDERTIELFNAGHVKGTAHSYVGQEAVATGACAHLTKDDSVISNHRGHGHCIAKGARTDRMMAELMGRASGYCGGLGGSMHVADLERNILGFVGIGPIHETLLGMVESRDAATRARWLVRLTDLGRRGA